jgi:hypothetical protein
MCPTKAMRSLASGLHDAGSGAAYGCRRDTGSGTAYGCKLPTSSLVTEFQRAILHPRLVSILELELTFQYFNVSMNTYSVVTIN